MIYKSLKMNIFFVSRCTTFNCNVVKVWQFLSFHHLSVKLSLKILLAIFCYSNFVLTDSFCTFRELGTSIFALNNKQKKTWSFQTRVYFLWLCNYKLIKILKNYGNTLQTGLTFEKLLWQFTSYWSTLTYLTSVLLPYKNQSFHL